MDGAKLKSDGCSLTLLTLHTSHLSAAQPHLFVIGGGNHLLQYYSVLYFNHYSFTLTMQYMEFNLIKLNK